MYELELKLQVRPERRAALLQALKRGRVRTERLKAAYFDTVDADLAKNGLALRLRREGGQWLQTAKGATGSALARLEHNASVPLPAAGEAPVVDLARHDGTPVGAALREVLGDGAGAARSLRLRFQTDVERTSRTVRSAGALVELAYDRGSVEANGRSLAIDEFELELKSGPPAALVALAGQWMSAHGLWLSTASKAERGGWLAAGEGGPKPRKAKSSKGGASSEAGVGGFVAVTTQQCLAQVLANASAVADGHAGDEFVHQLRVGVRRLRTALRELGDLVEGVDATWERTLRDTFHRLGDVRDRTVVMPGVIAELDAAGAPAMAAPDVLPSVHRPETVVRDPAFQKVLLALIAFSHAQSNGDPRAGGDARPTLVGRLDALLHRLSRDARRFAELDVDRQHRVRKRLKRMRYLSEFAAHVYGRKAVTRYLARWRDAQDELGAYNDCRVAAQLFRDAVDRDPRAWFAVGWLDAQQEPLVQRCARALRKAVGAKPFWRD